MRSPGPSTVVCVSGVGAVEGERACLEYLWGACKVMDVLDGRDVKERELAPLHGLVSHTSSLSEREDRLPMLEEAAEGPWRPTTTRDETRPTRAA